MLLARFECKMSEMFHGGEACLVALSAPTSRCKDLQHTIHISRGRRCQNFDVIVYLELERKVKREATFRNSSRCLKGEHMRSLMEKFILLPELGCRTRHIDDSESKSKTSQSLPMKVDWSTKGGYMLSACSVTRLGIGASCRVSRRI